MKQPTPAITYTEAFTQYFGTLSEVMSKPLPYKCKQCQAELLTLESCFEHIKIKHKIKVRTEKQIAAQIKRDKEKEHRS